MWIPRRVPIPSHRTQDELLCGGRPCSRGRLLPKYLDAIRPVIKKALTLAALTSGFQTLLTAARNQSPMVKTPSVTSATAEDTPADDRVTIPTTKEKTPPPPPGPSGLATVEDRLLWLQAEFTQLALNLVSAMTGVYQLKDSAGRLKRKLRARQARHRSHSLQE